jgi:hypothetical protein
MYVKLFGFPRLWDYAGRFYSAAFLFAQPVLFAALGSNFVTWSCVPVQSIVQLGKCSYVKRLWRLISEMIYLQRLREPLYEFFFD